MRDFSSFPGSRPGDIENLEALYTNTNLEFTSTESVDEQAIYDEMNKRLGQLETSLEVDLPALAEIQEDVQNFRVRYEEKEEIELRIDWLERLYKAKGQIAELKLKEEAEDLLRFISSVQTCPLKGELEKLLQEVKATLPASESTVTPEEAMMERAITEVGDDFINLGAAGRTAVIASIGKFGEQLDKEQIRAQTRELENQADQLKDTATASELAEQLNDLPLASWEGLDLERREIISRQLFGQKDWHGLAALDRSIHQLNRGITAEQKKLEAEQHLIQAGNNKAATIVDADSMREVHR